eukprot:Em0118g5a
MLDQAEQIQKDHEAHMQAAKAEMQTAKAEMLAAKAEMLAAKAEMLAAEEKMLAAKAEMLAAEEKMLAAKEEMQAGKADLQAANMMEAANTRYQTTVGLYKVAAGFYNEAVGTCGAKKKLYNEASEKSQEYMSNVAVCKSQVLKTTNRKISWLLGEPAPRRQKRWRELNLLLSKYYKDKESASFSSVKRDGDIKRLYALSPTTKNGISTQIATTRFIIFITILQWKTTGCYPKEIH